MEGQVLRVVIPMDARGHWDPGSGYSVSLTFPLRPLASKDAAPLSRENAQAILTPFEGVYGEGCVKLILPLALGRQVQCPPESKSEEKSNSSRA